MPPRSDKKRAASDDDSPQSLFAASLDDEDLRGVPAAKTFKPAPAPSAPPLFSADDDAKTEEAVADLRGIPSRILFRFAVPLRRRDEAWSVKGLKLGEEHRLPPLVGLDGRREYADVRAAWNEKGFYLSVLVAGKRKAPWCREGRLAESDGLNVWIDTRPSNQIHRASRFCHHFAFLPAGNNKRVEAPAAGQLLINRAKDQADPAPAERLKVRSETRPDGYLLECCIEAQALTGYDPKDYPQLGFTYLVHDAELGDQSFSLGHELPVREDPSLWSLVDLVR